MRRRDCFRFHRLPGVQSGFSGCSFQNLEQLRCLSRGEPNIRDFHRSLTQAVVERPAGQPKVDCQAQDDLPCRMS